MRVTGRTRAERREGLSKRPGEGGIRVNISARSGGKLAVKGRHSPGYPTKRNS